MAPAFEQGVIVRRTVHIEQNPRFARLDKFHFGGVAPHDNSRALVERRV
jgi:hypothetical protein